MANNLFVDFFILIASTFLASFGALFLKYGMSQIEKLNVKSVLSSIWLWIGIVLYVVSAIGNIILLSFFDYSVAVPIQSLTYVWTIFISYFIFKEKITLVKVISISLIIIGVMIIAS